MEIGFSNVCTPLQKTQRIGVGFMHDLVTDQCDVSTGRIELAQVDTAEQKGDSFTKFLAPKLFHQAMRLLGVSPQRQ